MKIIIAISTLAVIGATYFYQVQNTDKVESKQTAQTPSSAEPDITEEAATIDRPSNDEISKETKTAGILEGELKELSELTTKITSTKINKPKIIKSSPKKKMAKKIPAIKVVTTKAPKVVEDKVSTKAAGTISLTNLINDGASSKSKKFSGSLSLGANTDSKLTSDGEKSYGSTLSIGIGYKINDTYKVSLGLGGSKDISSSYEEKIGNTSLKLSHSGVKLAEKVTLAPSITGTYPTNKDSKVRDELNGALSLGSSLIYSVNSALTLIYAPGVKNNFYKFETSRVGKPLTEYQVTQSMIASYSFTDKLSAGPSFTYINAWTHAGSERDPAYETSFNLSYAYASNVGLSTGASTGGAHTITENGPDSNLEVYDSESTSFYGNISLTF